MHQKAVTARGQVGVKRRAPATGLDPAVIEALQLVAVLHLLRGNEAEARVLEFEPVGARLNRQFLIEAPNLVIHQNLFDDYRRGHAIFRRMRGIDETDPVQGGEPQASVGQLPGRRVAAAAALADIHAVRRAVGVHGDRLGRRVAFSWASETR